MGLSFHLLCARDFDFSFFGCVFEQVLGKSPEGSWAALRSRHKSQLGTRRSCGLFRTSVTFS
jgi:hypothetical protein